MLTQKQKLDFYENGYITVPGVVPQLMVDAARQAINHSIGEVGMHQRIWGGFGRNPTATKFVKLRRSSISSVRHLFVRLLNR